MNSLFTFAAKQKYIYETHLLKDEETCLFIRRQGVKTAAHVSLDVAFAGITIISFIVYVLFRIGQRAGFNSGGAYSA